MSWLRDVLGKDKVVVASLYLPPLPGSPDYRSGTGLRDLIAMTRRDVEALYEGGMDAIVFGNQQDIPWKVGVGHETTALMTRIVLEATQGIPIPFGITVFWDDLVAIAVAKATGAAFVRGVFRGVYAGEMGLLNLNAADALRYRAMVDAEGIKLVFVLRPILCQTVAPRDLESEVKDILWGAKPDGFALSGPIPGEAPSFAELKKIKKLAKQLPVLMNNGATIQNLGQVFDACDGAVVGTHLRVDNLSWKPFDKQKVVEFMNVAKQCRQG